MVRELDEKCARLAAVRGGGGGEVHGGGVRLAVGESAVAPPDQTIQDTY